MNTNTPFVVRLDEGEESDLARGLEWIILCSGDGEPSRPPLFYSNYHEVE